MPDYLGDDMRKVKKGASDNEEEEKEIRTLDEGDIALLKTYGQGPYSKQIKQVEDDIQAIIKRVNELSGIKESDTGLAPPSLWDLAADKQTLQNEQPLQVARCTKIIKSNAEDPNNSNDEPQYVINVKQFAKFVVDLADSVAPTDIEEGMRVGVDRNKYQIHIPLPPKIDPSVTMMQVEEKPDVTYADPERFVNLGIEPPKGVLLFGPPGTGKTLCARAVANRTDACFIRVIGSELVQKYVGEGARMVRELFEMARSKKACLIFFDEIDAIGGARFDDGAGGDNEVQRTMLELINQLDGFDPAEHKGADGDQPPRHAGPRADAPWPSRPKGGVRAPRPGREIPHLQDPRPLHVGGKGHSVRVASEAVSKLNGGRDQERVHGSWNVRNQSTEEGRN
ncbi:26S protease regulatory subunit 7 [Orchesella cincta]|uniref:26S proteasome regulatory subunit 7 n=1 Tax=Orchesella cincta TaxID=48709 RepID=A0A1D2MLJ4_ORCCI|nr:26S protease regulatory subunit 7 [Orchesella cincta]